MNTKDNQRSRLTKLLLKQTYMRLMREQPASKITVKELCEGAEVNRSTFYLHYSEPNDVLKELEDETIEQIRDALSSIGSLNENTARANAELISFLRYIERNEELFRTFLIENSDPHFRRKLQAVAMEIITSAFRVPVEPTRKRAVYLFLVSGSIEVLSDWLRSGCSMPEQELCRVLYALNEGGLRNVCFDPSAG